jgi:predicted lipid-binding transport protein (Tim44 family)
MSRSTSAPEALRTLRQRGSVALGIVAMSLGGLMAVLSVFSGEPSLILIGAMLMLVAIGLVVTSERFRKARSRSPSPARQQTAGSLAHFAGSAAPVVTSCPGGC